MQLNGKEVELRITGKTLLVYKESFKKNLMNVMRTIVNGTYDALDIYEIVYAILKSNGEMSGTSFDSFVEQTNPSSVIGEKAFSEILNAVNGMFDQDQELKKN